MGITLTQEVSSNLAILKASCFQLKTLENIHQVTPTSGKFKAYLPMNNENKSHDSVRIQYSC
jgi:hypothetical protein